MRDISDVRCRPAFVLLLLRMLNIHSIYFRIHRYTIEVGPLQIEITQKNAIYRI